MKALLLAQLPQHMKESTSASLFVHSTLVYEPPYNVLLHAVVNEADLVFAHMKPVV